jgi:hypothetical protein
MRLNDRRFNGACSVLFSRPEGVEGSGRGKSAPL